VALLGVGKRAASQRLEELLATVGRPERIVVAGFAGGLREGLALGDIVIASEIVDEFGGAWQTDWPADRSGCVLTCDKMIGEPELKSELGSKYHADVVDMESAVVAAASRRMSISFGCVRVISDASDTHLSQRLMTLVESGEVSIRQVVKQLLSSPHLIVELIRLAKHTRRAARRLANRLKTELA
jgi:nucleoside phosphorylase